MKSVALKAYAKVNLALDVLGKRSDGYHDVRMIMQNLDIYDELTFTLLDEGQGITIETNIHGIPTDERNLIHKAIKLMYEKYGINKAIHVKLTKNIPVEAGMAGGSTDCAAALKAVNMLFDLGADEKKLMELGVRLGADVPYCVMGRTALSEGIGEILSPVAGLPDCIVLVAKPPVGVSTGVIYNSLRLDELEVRPDIDGMLEALAAKNLKGVADRMQNVMETVTTKLCLDIEAIKKIMREQGALNAIMSGSGPTVFGIFVHEDKAQKAAAIIKKSNLADQIFVTRPV